MATTVLPNVIVKGVSRLFHQAMEATPTIWDKHCSIYNSTTAVENYAFPGFMPEPREFISGRHIQGLMDFTYAVTNKEYELSIIIQRKLFEDDQTGLVAERITEMAEAWATYKDKQFADLLTNGNVAGNLGFDGTLFHTDTRTIGSSANIDNNTTSNIGDTSAVTSSEFLLDLAVIKGTMLRYQDDQGRAGYNANAINNLRVVIAPPHEGGVRQALNASFITEGSTPAGSRENVFKGMAEFDVLPYLSGDTECWFNAVGAARKPFIYQERTPLEIVVMDDDKNVAYHNGVVVLARQRYVMTYGDPRRSVLHTWT
jgi:phage major head subunit gpT-like protein